MDIKNKTYNWLLDYDKSWRPKREAHEEYWSLEEDSEIIKPHKKIKLDLPLD